MRSFIPEQIAVFFGRIYDHFIICKYFCKPLPAFTNNSAGTLYPGTFSTAGTFVLMKVSVWCNTIDNVITTIEDMFKYIPSSSNSIPWTCCPFPNTKRLEPEKGSVWFNGIYCIRRTSEYFRIPLPLRTWRTTRRLKITFTPYLIPPISGEPMLLRMVTSIGYLPSHHRTLNSPMIKMKTWTWISPLFQ